MICENPASFSFIVVARLEHCSLGIFSQNRTFCSRRNVRDSLVGTTITITVFRGRYQVQKKEYAKNRDLGSKFHRRHFLEGFKLRYYYYYVWRSS